MNFQGKTAIVTGGGRGIGRAVSLTLAKGGANVVVNYVPGTEEDAQKTVEDCKALGVEASMVMADVSNADQVDEMFKTVVDTYGSVDILINNAGITKDNLIIRMKEEDFDKVIAINLKGAFNCMKTAARYMMKQRYGRIVSVSSIVGLRGNAGQVNYSASKAGIVGMTKSLAQELASRNVTCNAVAPGFIATAMTDALPENVRAEYAKSIPLGRLGSAEDVANAICFFCDENSGYLTGQVICVDGGLAM